MKYLFLLWNIYFGYELLKIGLNIHNLYYFYWYTLTSLLFSHLWIILIHAYNFKYMFLTLLQPNYFGMHFIIWNLKIITYRIIQARKMYQLFIFQFICIQLDKSLNWFIYIYIFEWHYPKNIFFNWSIFYKKYNNNN